MGPMRFPDPRDELDSEDAQELLRDLAYAHVVHGVDVARANYLETYSEFSSRQISKLVDYHLEPNGYVERDERSDSTSDKYRLFPPTSMVEKIHTGSGFDGTRA